MKQRIQKGEHLNWFWRYSISRDIAVQLDGRNKSLDASLDARLVLVFKHSSRYLFSHLSPNCMYVCEKVIPYSEEGKKMLAWKEETFTVCPVGTCGRKAARGGGTRCKFRHCQEQTPASLRAKSHGWEPDSLRGFSWMYVERQMVTRTKGRMRISSVVINTVNKSEG